MPGAKERKPKAKGAPLTVSPILQRFLKTYEKHCAQTRTAVCPAIKRDLKASISDERMLRKALLLESRGRPRCSLSTLELIDCRMDSWSLGRLGLALQFSGLRSLVLDYFKCGKEELENLCSGLKSSRQLRELSLRFCGLGPQSGPGLGSLAQGSTVCILHLDGNNLQSSGALALLRPLAEFAETQGTAQPAKSSDTPQLLQAGERGQPTLSHTTALAEALSTKTASGKKKTKKRKKAIKKKVEDLAETGPWLVKLHLADNGIDGKGKGGESGLLEFIQILTCLITHSTHLRELDLGNNVVGEKAAVGILEALRARKTGKLPILKIKVTPQISSDTFRSIWKNSKKSKMTLKKKKKVKN
ncbi:uncharacterized protein LOC132540358 isoform X2 [Erinaceus europaeus]|uniref:Uncharacterized protein LOC132540358 isoform X2 n=1 Tax=Erinaceus europaeus TaxID=9365 RepID=A0ABM3XXC3_ERIEU|nr:uncharacterized protein LOC132540358 isoform X2 [Erinaceus europaeus]